MSRFSLIFIAEIVSFVSFPRLLFVFASCPVWRGFIFSKFWLERWIGRKVIVFPMVWPRGGAFLMSRFSVIFIAEIVSLVAFSRFLCVFASCPVWEEFIFPSFSSNDGLSENFWCFQWFGHEGGVFLMSGFSVIFIAEIVSLVRSQGFSEFASCPVWRGFIFPKFRLERWIGRNVVVFQRFGHGGCVLMSRSSDFHRRNRLTRGVPGTSLRVCQLSRLARVHFSQVSVQTGTERKIMVFPMVGQMWVCF